MALRPDNLGVKPFTAGISSMPVSERSRAREKNGKQEEQKTAGIPHSAEGVDLQQSRHRSWVTQDQGAQADVKPLLQGWGQGEASLCWFWLSLRQLSFYLYTL